MKKIRILSAILAILLAFSAVSLPVFAADVTSGVDITTYPTTEYDSQSEKLATMTLLYESKEDGYALYFDTQSGEFALKNLKSGEYTFSNPYDVAVSTESSSASSGDGDKIRHALLSQVILTYSDTETGSTGTMFSYTDAATAGGQITYKVLSDGVRVEYALGTVETKRLIPQWIEKSRFETQILDILALHKGEMSSEELQIYNGILNSSALYTLVGPASDGAVYDPQGISTPERPDSYKFLVDNEGAQMYVLMGIGERAKKNIENLIRKYCPEYTYDKLEEDHEITGYEGNEKEPPLFRLAVEYTIDKDGLTASIPAKSIRYNETNYTLENLVLLPYFGCTTLKTTGAEANSDGKITRNDGYIFIPDGSGTLLSFYNADGSIKSGIQGCTLYGMDYALESLSATDANAEAVRIPVFGLVEGYEVSKSVSRGEGRPLVGNKIVTEDYDRGFVAIIEEGDSFASIRANLREMAWAGASGTTEYSAVYALFNVKQSDSVQTGSSIGNSNASMTATNDTKYTGNYTIRYTLLSNDENTYESSYIGMANAYRDYLIENGAIDKLVSGEIESSIPLYIHSFGALEAEDTILSIPVTVVKPLTTFEDVITMAEDLKASGIKNVNFILEGFANGNMSEPYYPSYVDWSKTVGGEKGLQKLLDYASESGIGVYPEFDFATVAWSKLTKGFSMRKHAAQTMSGRYTTFRDYDYVYQSIMAFGMKNIVSSGVYLELFEKFADDYDEYNVGAISVMSLGNVLTSDYNEDYPITREDAKTNTEEVLAEMKDKYTNVLTSGGNAYTFPSVNSIVDMPLDNSRYQISSYSVPFMGIVLHGYMNYTGSIINTAGDVQYEVLKALENGAALYFLLSYQNVSELKSAMKMGLSDNYSVSYQTWKEDVVAYYNMLNDAIGSLQSATITGHSFLTAYRMDATMASFMFGQFNNTLKAFADKEAKYLETMDIVDQLRFNSQEAEATAKLQEEIALRNEYNVLLERANLAEDFANKYNVEDVVSVTYTEDNGNKTTFYINYNAYDVAIEVDGGIYVLAAESFVNTKDIKAISLDSIAYETVTAIQPTAGQLTSYNNAYENYAAAVATGDERTITRAKNALDKVLAQITKSTTHVVKLTNTDGDVCYFNYTTSTVLVPVSATEYVEVAPQSYNMK